MENRYDDREFFDEYARMERSVRGLDGAGEWHMMRELFPDVRGKTVLDLGCGYGWHCAYARERGAASVLGIDGSRLMAAEAGRRSGGGGITYSVCAIEDYPYPPEAFDLVLSNLALHYVEDLAAVYRGVFRTLRPGGVFLFNIEHPTFTAGRAQQFAEDGTWPVENYFYPGERETVFLGKRVVKYHHTLTQILGGLLDAGFVLEAVREAEPPEEWRAAMPEEMSRPMMLLVRARKCASAAEKARGVD